MKGGIDMDHEKEANKIKNALKEAANFIELGINLKRWHLKKQLKLSDAIADDYKLKLNFFLSSKKLSKLIKAL